MPSVLPIGLTPPSYILRTDAESPRTSQAFVSTVNTSDRLNLSYSSQCGLSTLLPSFIVCRVSVFFLLSPPGDSSPSASLREFVRYDTVYNSSGLVLKYNIAQVRMIGVPKTEAIQARGIGSNVCICSVNKVYLPFTCYNKVNYVYEKTKVLQQLLLVVS
jgi:hypothetical protein